MYGGMLSISTITITRKVIYSYPGENNCDGRGKGERDGSFRHTPASFFSGLQRLLEQRARHRSMHRQPRVGLHSYELSACVVYLQHGPLVFVLLYL